MILLNSVEPFLKSGQLHWERYESINLFAKIVFIQIFKRALLQIHSSNKFCKTCMRPHPWKHSRSGWTGLRATWSS